MADTTPAARQTRPDIQGRSANQFAERRLGVFQVGGVDARGEPVCGSPPASCALRIAHGRTSNRFTLYRLQTEFRASCEPWFVNCSPLLCARRATSIAKRLETRRVVAAPERMPIPGATVPRKSLRFSGAAAALCGGHLPELWGRSERRPCIMHNRA